jgi:hypothetical protein
MQDNNSVHLVGTVKRDATQGDGVMDFAIEVPNHKGTMQIFDCRLTQRSDAWDELEGFVEEGEPIEVIGHLEKRTTTDGTRINGVWVDVRNTQTIIYVDNVVTED